MRSDNSYSRWAKYFIGCLSVLFVTPVQAYTPVPKIAGPEVTVEGILGVRCSARAGDSPGLYAQGGKFRDDETAMFGIVIPLHPKVGDCKTMLSYEQAMARLAIAESLLERGLITPEEYKAVADKVHQTIKP